MVVALGPGKFYGSSLPRPRFYTDIKFSAERVDPPIPVTEPFMSWAAEAHWSMGGLNLKRHRLQGRIEGSVKKLRAEREKFQKTHNINKVVNKPTVDSVPAGSKLKVRRSPSPPPAPVAHKRRRYLGLVDESEDEEEQEREVVRKRPARKLTEDFDRVAAETGMKKKRVSSSNSPAKSSGSGSEGVGLRTRSRRSEQVEEKGGVTPTSRSRKSPRLVKRWTK